MLEVGKRYHCETCGTEVLITKPSDGHLACCGAPMQLREPKQVPSAD